MGYNQEAYDAECAALARALELASRRQTMPERVTIFTDAQAAIRRMASEEPGPDQQYALQPRKHIAALLRARPSSSLRSDGAWLTKGLRATRRRTSGLRSRRGSQTPAGWNG